MTDSSLNGNIDREHLRTLVLRAGFDRVGFARAGPAPSSARFLRWLERGFAADMAYLGRAPERRTDPRNVLEGARTVIAVALHYPGPGEGPGPGEDQASRTERAACPTDPAAWGAEPGAATIAAYARGADYHRVLGRRLRAVCRELSGVSSARFRYYVDTGPVLERDWAQEAGIGWVGKNACLIDPARGSYCFLGVILTTLEVDPDEPSADHCGRCRKCLDACPTGALVSPHELDSRLCISYHTIESRGPIPPSIGERMGSIVFGCDICQAVCPYNHRPGRHCGPGRQFDPGPSCNSGPPSDPGGLCDGSRTCDPELAPRPELIAPGLDELAALDAEGFRRRFRGTPVLRAKFEGFTRCVIVALGNDTGSAPKGSAPATLSRLALRPEILRSPVLSATLEEALRRRGLREPGGPPA